MRKTDALGTALLIIVVFSVAGTIAFLAARQRGPAGPSEHVRESITPGPAYKQNLDAVRYSVRLSGVAEHHGHASGEGSKGIDPRNAPLPRCPKCGAAVSYLDDRCSKCGHALGRMR